MPRVRACVDIKPLAECTSRQSTLHLGGGETSSLVALTAFDSGHCPGSAAFLFEGACGRVLHTGDWRLEDLCVQGTRHVAPRRRLTHTPRRSALPACVTRAPLDVVYLDNTFCHPSYDHPPRAAALAQVQAALEAHEQSGAGGRVLIGIDTLGKEELLEAAAAATGGQARTCARSHVTVCCSS